MDTLFLLQFACLVFMLVSAGYLGLSSLHVRWHDRRYERSRWMIFAALLGLAGQYLVQMCMRLRASGDDLGAVANMLVYTPCFMLIAKGIYNVEATHLHRHRMSVMCAALYAAIVAVFAIGYWHTGSYRIGPWLYVMLFFYGISMVYCVCVILREMLRRRRLLETMAASDMLPYVRYSRASLFIISSVALVMPAAILSSTLLYIVAPVVLLALLFFILTFIALGNSYVPTDELLINEEEREAALREAASGTVATASAAVKTASATAETDHATRPAALPAERCALIRQRLDDWCARLGYRDSSVNMMTLSRGIGISKNELTQYFDQCLHCTFRVWLSDIRFQAAKSMMRQYPDYSNDVISVECGFSARTQLYRIFKSKEGCTPTAWRDRSEKRE